MFLLFYIIIWNFDAFSGQTFSEILRISEKDWQLSPQFSKKVYLIAVQASLRHTNVVEEHFWRTKDSVANPSENHGLNCQCVLEILWISEKDLNLSSVYWRTANQKSMKIGEPQAQLAIQDFKNLGKGLVWNASKLRMAVSRLKKHLWYLKTRSGSYSGQKTTLKISCDRPFKGFRKLLVWSQMKWKGFQKPLGVTMFGKFLHKVFSASRKPAIWVCKFGNFFVMSLTALRKTDRFSRYFRRSCFKISFAISLELQKEKYLKTTGHYS
jgi:hypothetical protein